MPYIVGIDFGDDKVVNKAVNMLYQAWNCTVVDYFQDGDWPSLQPGDVVYLVGHGNATTGMSNVDLRGANNLDQRLRDLLRAAEQTVLVSCSTANESQLLLDGGFQARTWAQNLSAQLRIEVVGATGPVVVQADALIVDSRAGGGWVGFGGANGQALGPSTDPIGEAGRPADGDGDGGEVGGEAARRAFRKPKRHAPRPTA